MTRFHYVSLLLGATLTALTFAACSGGGGSTGAGKFCAASMSNPVSMKPGKNQKAVSLKVGDSGDARLPDGNYTYDHADLYYQDKSGYHVYVQDLKQNDGSFKASINCVGGHSDPTVPLKPLDITTDGVFSMKVATVAGQQTAVVNAREVHFEIKNTAFSTKSASVSGATDSPEKVYDNKTVTEAIMIQTSNNGDYEIQSSGPATDSTGTLRGTYYLSVHLKRAN